MRPLKILYFLFILLFFTGSQTYGQGKKRIGLLMDDFNSSRWAHDSTLFCKKVRAAGHEVIVRVCDSDTTLQLKQAEELIKETVDVLVVVPASSMAAKAIVTTARKNNVPVIAYDRLILNCDLNYFISFDGEKVGQLQADYILKKINYSGSVMIMNGPEHDLNSLLFKKGQMNVLKPYIDKGAVKIIYDRFLSEWTSMEAYMEANDFLTTYNGKVDGIIAANDDLAQGIIEALSIFRASEKIPVTGQDATVSAYYNILNNLQGMTVYKPIDILATQAAELACDLANKKAPASENLSIAYNGLKNIPFIKLEPIAITKENVQTLLIQSNYLSDEYLKGKK